VLCAAHQRADAHTPFSCSSLVPLIEPIERRVVAMIVGVDDEPAAHLVEG